ncbi:uncharacterized protein LOC106168240 [Lingula anatina]|uniref:Uncharacterized protein LOC106168240 n=1 Tax=Lingula anatina TaxID=7574 RepID=A0A1S3IXJ4_LINAN|nr:uncharacterized protein LOC106168240 [Lingula anatina]|eukprot:XP_013402696.1 uncharacterized protein LOC106168240 [Lingula anatina]
MQTYVPVVLILMAVLGKGSSQGFIATDNCTVCGDPHFITFDGKRGPINLVPGKWHVLAKDNVNNPPGWMVTALTEFHKGGPRTKLLTVSFTCRLVDGTDHVDSVDMASVSHLGPVQLFDCPVQQVDITIGPGRCVKITVAEPRWINGTAGPCGDNDGNKLND